MSSSAYRQHSPTQLLRCLSIAAVISLITILSAAGYGICTLYETYVINDARHNAISLGQAFVSSRQEKLRLQFGLEQDQPIREAHQLQRLDRQIESFLSPYNILKIKIFSNSGQILYSTDHSIIGQDNSDNERLQKALNGATDAQIQSKNQILDLSREAHFDVDVVETYVPIFDPQQNIIGAFEIYQDMTTERQTIRQGVYLSVSILGLILITVYSTACYFIRHTARRLLSAQQELERLAMIDPLTQVYNRREILHRAEHELARFKRAAAQSGRHYCIMMIDVDHFKPVNDTFGHQVGDAVLEQVAKRLSSTLRAGCCVGRYGGEEFLALIPDADLQQAETIAQRLLSCMHNAAIEVRHQALEITVSIGVITTAVPTVEFDYLLAQADSNLYQAKATGRNRFMATVCLQPVATATPVP